MVRNAVARVARATVEAFNLRSDSKSESNMKTKVTSHQLLAVVKMVDRTYHVWAKEPQHVMRRHYNAEVGDLLTLAFGFRGDRSCYCTAEQPKLKHFQHDKVDWNPRLVDWSKLVDFSVLVDLNYDQCHIVPEDESPFKGKIKPV